MKTKFTVLFIICFAFYFRSKAQINIVPNNDFEIYSACPPSSASFPANWYVYNTPDTYNVCDTTSHNFGIPMNWFGHQYPYSGNAYVGLVGYSQAFFGREYVGIQLSNILVAGQIYYVAINVSLADTALYAIKNIGALFTNTVFNPPSSSVSSIPQIENTGAVITDKTNWVTISGSFVAVGDEQYITIGNFRNDANTVKQFVGNGNPSSTVAYYYIDDVYVGETPLTIDEKEKECEVKLFPNPANAIVTIAFKNKNVAAYTFEITNLLGQLQSANAEIKNNTISINTEALPMGIYFVKLVNKEDNTVVVRKVVRSPSP